MRRVPIPSRSGARPSVAKSIREVEDPTEARGRLEDDTVLIIRGVMIIGATASTTSHRENMTMSSGVSR